MALQAAEGHVLVDQKPLVPLSAEADEADEVGMAEHGEHEHLHQELGAPLHALPGELLHRHHLRLAHALYDEEEIDRIFQPPK